MRLALATVIGVVFTIALAPAQQRGGQGTAGGAAATQPKFKAIWEPVNVKEDVSLMSVDFVSAEEGWVAGGVNDLNGGVILHTSDGGANWTAQLGDPQSSDRAYRHLRFLGAKLGWAVQVTGSSAKLLRTTDGETWVPVGVMAEHFFDYQFVSAEAGFFSDDDRISRTQDAGKSWKSVFQCRVKAEVGGLTRDLRCEIAKMSFVSPTVGYGVGATNDRNAGVVVASTADGGDTWKVWTVLPGEYAMESGLHFFDGKTGVLRTQDGKMFRTADGGQTWIGASGMPEGKPEVQFADMNVGWMIRYNAMTFTTNGGRQWVSRNIAFPAPVGAFSLVRPDRGYAVGGHGMVYRYRIVPIEYTAKGMLAAPMMPAAPGQ